MLDSQQHATALEHTLQELRDVLWRALAYSSAVSVLVLAPFYYMLEVYGRVVDSRSFSTLGWLFLMLVIMLALMEALDGLRKEWLSLAACHCDEISSQAIYQALQQRNQATGQLPGLAPFQDLKTVRDAWQSPAVLAILELPASVIFLLLLYGIHPLLAMAALAGVTLFVALQAMQRRYSQRPLESAQHTYQRSDLILQDAVENRHSALVMGMVSALFCRWQQRRLQALRDWTDASDLSNVFNALNKALNLVFSSGLLGLSAYLLISGNLPAGAAGMILASTLGGRLLAPLGVLIANGKSLTQAHQAWQRLQKLLAQHKPTAPTMPLPPPQGRLEVEHLCVAYPGQKAQALHGIHFQLSPGELLLVVGASGSGKSTLARALMGLLPPSQGHARIDGAELFDWLRNGLGSHVGYLPQSVDIHEGTLAQNITRFSADDPVRASESLQAAVRDWQLDSLISLLAKGLQTPLAEGGAHLSGGERQKIGLARAYFGQPRYVVLDEPDSALDQAALALLMQQMAQNKKQGVTQVVITHRLSLAPVADKVLVLQNGTQQAFGPASKLIQKRPSHENA